MQSECRDEGNSATGRGGQRHGDGPADGIEGSAAGWLVRLAGWRHRAGRPCGSPRRNDNGSHLRRQSRLARRDAAAGLPVARTIKHKPKPARLQRAFNRSRCSHTPLEYRATAGLTCFRNESYSHYVAEIDPHNSLRADDGCHRKCSTSQPTSLRVCVASRRPRNRARRNRRLFFQPPGLLPANGDQHDKRKNESA
jgi:hypothetical protein